MNATERKHENGSDYFDSNDIPDNSLKADFYRTGPIKNNQHRFNDNEPSSSGETDVYNDVETVGDDMYSLSEMQFQATTPGITGRTRVKHLDMTERK